MRAIDASLARVRLLGEAVATAPVRSWITVAMSAGGRALGLSPNSSLIEILDVRPDARPATCGCGRRRSRLALPLGRCDACNRAAAAPSAR